jgi:hypothetical protein
MTSTNQTINVSEIIKAGQRSKVDIAKISIPEYHDRTDVDDQSNESLANNMSEVGQLNPILLDKKSDSHFELISGLRRYDAALKLNWSNIDAIVFQNLDEQSKILIMIAENAQRKSLNDYDLVNSLVHFVATSTGKSDNDVVAFLTKMKNLDAGNVKSLSFDEKKLQKAMEDALNRTDKYSLKSLVSKVKVLNFHPALIKAMKEHKLLYTYALNLNKVKDEQAMNDLLNQFVSGTITKDELKKEIRNVIGNSNNPAQPFATVLKKLKEYNKLSEETQQAITAKMQEIDGLLAS